MSGGSYEYLYIKDAQELIGYQYQRELERMAQRLAGLGYAEDAAREAEELLCIIRQSVVRIETRMKRLSGIFRAVEWVDSGDSREDYIKRELAEYRGETEGGDVR